MAIPAKCVAGAFEEVGPPPLAVSFVLGVRALPPGALAARRGVDSSVSPGLCQDLVGIGGTGRRLRRRRLCEVAMEQVSRASIGMKLRRDLH